MAPFKAQNMSNNSMVCRTRDGVGAEIGRAQWSQALAARAVPEPAMNPVLLKPGSDRRSHVVVMGQPAGDLTAADFLGGRTQLRDAAFAAYDDLAGRYDLVVAEGAGSPAEINLRAGDFVNLGLARHARMPAVVVGDIDRGGVFASMFGTVALLDAADQRLLAGWVVNKFRGDPGLLTPGLDELHRLTGRPVYGVLPWHPDLWLDSEDALDLGGRRAPERAGPTLRVAVVRLPRISNFTDVDALGLEPAVDVVFAAEPRALAGADVVVLPGTRATLADLAWLRERGLDRAIGEHAAAGRPVLGICGGFQMLGRTVSDPEGVEGPAGAEAPGLGLLDVATVFGPEKVLALPHGSALRGGGARLRDPPRPGQPRAGGRGVPRRCGCRGRLRDDVARQPRVRRVPPGLAGRWPRRPRARRTPPRGSASPSAARPASSCSPTWSRSTSTWTRCWTSPSADHRPGCRSCRPAGPDAPRDLDLPNHQS